MASISPVSATISVIVFSCSSAEVVIALSLFSRISIR
jgi:hypothetical protein